MEEQLESKKKVIVIDQTPVMNAKPVTDIEFTNQESILEKKVIDEMKATINNIHKSYDKEYWDKYINTQKAIKSLFKTQLSKSDLKYINFIIKGCKFKKKASIKNWFIALYYLIINTNNFGYNNPFIRNIHFLLSDRITIKLKKTYYYYLKLLK